MGRRSKSECWKPRQVHAMVTPEDRARAAVECFERSMPGYTPAPASAPRRPMGLLGSGEVRPCVHGNPWTKCALCGPLRVPR